MSLFTSFIYVYEAVINFSIYKSDLKNLFEFRLIYKMVLLNNLIYKIHFNTKYIENLLKHKAFFFKYENIGEIARVVILKFIYFYN